MTTEVAIVALHTQLRLQLQGGRADVGTVKLGRANAEAAQ